MDIIFKLGDPRELKATMTITMTVETWRDLRDQLQLSKSWPLSELTSQINDIIQQVEKVYWPEGDK